MIFLDIKSMNLLVRDQSSAISEVNGDEIAHFEHAPSVAVDMQLPVSVGSIDIGVMKNTIIMYLVVAQHFYSKLQFEYVPVPSSAHGIIQFDGIPVDADGSFVKSSIQMSTKVMKVANVPST